MTDTLLRCSLSTGGFALCGVRPKALPLESAAFEKAGETLYFCHEISILLISNIGRREKGDLKDMAEINGEDMLPLEEFIKLPTTVDFQAVATESFFAYAAERPYIRPGTVLANGYVIVYTDEKYIPQIYNDLGGDFLFFAPKIMSPVDMTSNDSAGITRVLEQPFLQLSGGGVIIGIVDTGIDFTLDAFRYEDGTTKLLGLWDQTVDGKKSEGILFGAAYNRDEINSALENSNPLSLIPSYDEDGHGTFLASVAAANTRDSYMGAAPGANLICVKLRRARQYYIDSYLLPQDNPALYESTDYLLGVKYILDQALRLGMPAVILVGMGSNTSAHDGNTLFEDYISYVSQRPGFAFVTAAGNESNAKHHTQGIISDGGTEKINIKVGKQGVSFGTIIFNPSFDKVSVSVTSPTGEILARKPFRPGTEYTEKLILEDTAVILRYSRDVNDTIWVGLDKATEGIWEITLYGDKIVDGSYQAWLPITGQVDSSVEFLRPVPDYTIVYPAAAARTITCGAYSSFDGSLFVSSSWGPTRQPRISPDITAPGVKVSGIFPESYGIMTGTSVSAAVTAGAAALLMEWGIVKKNMPSMNGDLIRSMFIGGAQREKNIEYPNNKWGYGKLDLYNTFNYLREN